MSSQWRDFLAGRSATAAPGGASASDCALFDLSHLGLIRVQGDDAVTFLQGQLTNDIRELSATHTQLSGHCSPKGRLLAVFHVMRVGDDLLLQLPRELLPRMLDRLRLFVLRSNVVLSDASEDLIRIGLAGESAPELLTRRGLRVPRRESGLATTDGVSVVRLPGPTPRFELVGGFEPVAKLWDALAAKAVVANRDTWALHDIRAGVPTVLEETIDAFVPQMVNLQLIDGVSFTKGCYTGQEIVARMQYLGKLKRRMYLAEVDTDVAPAPGAEIHSAASTSEQASGRVVDARATGDGRFELLAVVEIDAAEAGDARLGEDGPTLRFRPPPYGFPAGA